MTNGQSKEFLARLPVGHPVIYFMTLDYLRNYAIANSLINLGDMVD